MVYTNRTYKTYYANWDLPIKNIIGTNSLIYIYVPLLFVPNIAKPKLMLSDIILYPNTDANKNNLYFDNSN